MISYITKKYGSDAKFESIKLAKPAPKDGEVLIEVKAVGLNYLDNHILRHKSAINPDLPATLHGEVSGVVSALGKGVHQFETGESVFGYAGGLRNHSGALTEFMTADAKLLTFKPKKLSFIEAAALPFAAISAWEALFDGCHLLKGDHILIYNAMSDTGHIAIQLAKAHGAIVAAGVKSDSDASILRKLGADEIINQSSQPVNNYVKELTGGRGFDIILDATKGINLHDAIEAICPYGRISFLFSPQANLQLNTEKLSRKSIMVYFQNTTTTLLNNIHKERHSDILQQTINLIENNLLKPLINKKIYNFSNINSAHNDYENNNYQGKIVLTRE